MTTGTATTRGTAWGTHSSTAVYHVYETFVIEGENYVYVARERLRWAPVPCGQPGGQRAGEVRRRWTEAGGYRRRRQAA
jgi:hypothetical protein